MCRAGNGAAAATDPAQSRRQAGNEYACDCRRSSEYFRSEEKLSGSPAHLRLIFSSCLSEGLRPSDSPTRSLARRFDGSLRSRGLASLRSLAPASDPRPAPRPRPLYPTGSAPRTPPHAPRSPPPQTRSRRGGSRRCARSRLPQTRSTKTARREIRSHAGAAPNRCGCRCRT
jgi:hypothetical protein